MAFVAANIDATGEYGSAETVAGFSIPYIEETDCGTDGEEGVVGGGIYM